MRLFFLLFFICCIGVSANTYAQKGTVNVDANGKTIRQLLESIEEQTPFRFFYNSEFQDLDKLLHASYEEKSVEDVLASVFDETNVSYKIMDNNFVIITPLALLQQTIIVTGTVTDVSGSPLPGVNIKVKGASVGAITDMNGNYTIQVPNADAVLVFSFIGYATQEYRVGELRQLKVILQEGSELIDEVVVTALGIKREEKALGYSVQTVKGEVLTTVKGAEIASQLTGKIAGVTVYNSSDFANAPTIKIRGEDPLYVVDGVAFPNMTLRHLAQDDIESITVLKGSTAAALYGYRGGTGAILITTKRGSVEEGISVSVSSGNMFSAGFATMIENQTSYSSGIGGRYDPEDYVWGDKLDIGRTALQYDPYTYEWREMPLESRGKDNFRNFIENSIVTNNNVSVAYKGKLGSFRTSLTHTYDKGIYPNNHRHKFNYMVAGNIKLGKLELDAAANIVKRTSPQIFGEGYGLTGVIYSIMLWTGAEYDLRDYRNYWQKGKEDVAQNWWSPVWYNNPWFTQHEITQSIDTDVYSGQFNLSYEILPWLKAFGRVGSDGVSQLTQETTPISTRRKALLGEFYEQYIKRWTVNGEAMLMAEKQFGDFSVDGFVGGSIYYNKSSWMEGRTAGGLSIPGFYSLRASVEPITYNVSSSKIRNNSVYGKVGASWKNMIFVEATGRNDWVSTLAADERSFFYPSASGSFILTEVLPKINLLNFWKVRGSWTQTKIPPDVYSINTTYGININNMYKGQTGAEYPVTSRSGTLKPATREEWEIGTEARFLDARLRVDVAHYRRLYYNNQRSAPISKASGFSSMLVNWDEEYLRKGWEVTLAGDIIKTKDWLWTSMFNWERMRYVYHKIDPIYSQQYYWVAEGKQVNWEARGDFEKSPDGQLVHRADGLLQKSTANGRFYKDPDWVWGWTNTLKYKNFTLAFSLDGRVGGQNDNDSDWDMWRTGSHPDSDNQWRYDEVVNGLHNYVGKGVKITNGGTVQYNYDGTIASDTREFGVNDTQASYEQYIRQMYGGGPITSSVFDLTFLKFREISLGYSLPKEWCKKVKMNNVEVSLIGQNLAIWVKEFRWADPDKGQDNENAPLSRLVGFNVKIDF